MHVLSSTSDDQRTFYELLDRARSVHLAMGHEDVVAALGEGRVLLFVESENDVTVTTAAVVLEVEPRPDSLPAGAPERVFLRGALFAPHLSPTTAMRYLLDACAGLPRPAPQLLIAYGEEGWFNRALLDSRMQLTEQVHYFELPNLQRRRLSAPLVDPAVTISPASPADLTPLAALDGATFDPLWHCSVRDLGDLLLRGTLLVARTRDTLAGYVALLVERDGAMIARLAVRREEQSRGIGRRLLLEALNIARAQGCTAVLLNTQASNVRAQRLYRSIGFRPTGQRIPIYTRELPVTEQAGDLGQQPGV